MKYLDLQQEYPLCLADVFACLFLDHEFEQEFLTQTTESTNSPNSSQILHRATVTDWIFDPHQDAPSLSLLLIKHGAQLKGIDTRMKFYKIRETDDGIHSKFAPVTENQVG